MWRSRLLLFYMLRVPLLFLGVLGVGLPWGFTTSMLHGLADILPSEVYWISLLASLLVSAAMTGSFLILLYGKERADGGIDERKPEDRITTRSVVLLYVYGSFSYLCFLFFVFQRMKEYQEFQTDLFLQFSLWALAGLVTGFAVIMIFFLGALRLAKPDDDEALEVFAFPVFLLVTRYTKLGTWTRSFKRGTASNAATGSYASHSGFLSGFFAELLGPGYGACKTGDAAAKLHSGHRFVSIVMGIFLALYLFIGRGMLQELQNSTPWTTRGAENSVLSYLLILLIFWCCFLTGITFFVDRFRFSVVIALAAGLYIVSVLGSSDHYFDTVQIQKSQVDLRTPAEYLENAPENVIVVAAAGGGIQSAAWTSKVLCGLRAEIPDRFQKSVIAISGVSGGSVGTMFYLRCLEEEPTIQAPADWAQLSSLEAVAWGLTHPDLRRIFMPGHSETWSKADRGWALEHSLLKYAQFKKTERRLAENHENWPAILLNSTEAETGDPIVFTNSQFPRVDPNVTQFHRLQNFHVKYPGNDVFLETAARMSASFPYVSPAARPDGNNVNNGTHLVDGGYFDNSGVFTLTEWLKEAVFFSMPEKGKSDSSSRQNLPREKLKKRILILQLDAFPDGPPQQQKTAQKWYYQLYAPIAAMLKVRSEAQLVRDEVAGKDLQDLLRGEGYATSWLLVRYDPGGSGPSENEKGKLVPNTQQEIPNRGNCKKSPPLSWHLTKPEKACINQEWEDIHKQTSDAVCEFLENAAYFSQKECDAKNRPVAQGVYERRCPAIVAEPATVPNGGNRSSLKD